MNIHILIGYVANMLRHINKMSVSRINLNLNYPTQDEDYIVRELVVDCQGQNLPQDFNPKDYLSEYHLPNYSINQFQNKIIISPLNPISFTNFQQEFFHNLKLRLFDINTPIFINDLQINTNIQGINWTFEDDTAYYLVNSVFDQCLQPAADKRQHYIRELDYHLDKLVICNGTNRPDILDITFYGFSGVIVPKKPLLLTKENLTNKKDCPVWQKINSKLCSALLKRINSWQRGINHPVLSRINRTILFNELTPLQLTSYQLLAIMDAPLFSTANGTKLNVLNLLKPDKINFYLDESNWSGRNTNEINYQVDCAEFFGNLSSNNNHHFVRLLNSPQYQIAIFLELVEKYFNTISGCYKYKTVFPEGQLKHLEQQRIVFHKNIQLNSKVQWVFHFNHTEVIYEFGFNGLSKAKSLELAA